MKRLTAIAAAAVMATAGLAWGDYPPTAAAPAGYPPTAQAAQQQQPPPPPQDRPAPRVQVFPFQPVGSAGTLDWIGQGIQQGLQTDVSHTGAMLVIAAAALPPHTTPVEAAKASQANLAVTGTYQVQGDQVRADGQLVDVATGQPVGGFSAKAPLGSVFQLEDAMGAQLQRLLPLEHPAPQPVAGSYNYDGTPTAPPPQSVTVVNDPTPSYTEPATVNNSVYYDAPATAYSYPDSFYGGYGGGYGYDDYPYVGYYSPFAFGFYGGLGYYGGYRGYHGYGYGHDYDHGYGHGYDHGRDYGHGFGGIHSNPTFHTPAYGGGFGRGYVLNGGGGRSYSVGNRGGGMSGFHSGAFGGGGLHGGGIGGGGGFHGGGGGHR